MAAEVERALEELRHGHPVPTAPTQRLAEEELLRRSLQATPEEREALKQLFRQWGLDGYRLSRLRQARSWERAYSALVLGRMQVREALAALLQMLADKNTEMRLAALRALELLEDPEALDPLIHILPEVKDSGWRVVWAALISCARTRPERLLAYITHPEPQVRAVVASVLGEVAPPALLVELLAHANEPDPEVRAKLARALGRSGSPRALPLLAQWTQDPVWYVRLQAVGALGALRDRSAHEFLLRATSDPNLLVRQKAAAALYLFWADPIYLIDLLRQSVPDRSALEALLSVLEWRGVTWEAINHVNSPLDSQRDQSRELVRRLIQVGAYAAVFYAIAMHPEAEVRRVLVELVGQVLPAEGYLDLVQVLASPHLDAGTRRAVEKLVGFPEELAHDMG